VVENFGKGKETKKKHEKKKGYWAALKGLKLAKGKMKRIGGGWFWV